MAGSEGSGEDRRHPRNLEGLLKFCLESTSSEDASGSSQFEPMSDEARGWLREAIQSFQGTDPVKVMLEDIKVILESGNTEDDIEKKENALEDLQMYCEDLDLANDFHKIGGYSLLELLLKSPVDGLRWRTAELMATLTQNNPYSQKAVLDAGLLPTLLEKVDRDEADSVRIKALYAVSCLTREHPEGQEAFMKLDGFSILMRAMSSDVDKLQFKSAFLLSYLCIQEPQYKDTLCDIGMVEQLVGLLHQEHNQNHEQLMKALLDLVSGHQRSLQECRRPELELDKLLKDRIQLLKGKSEFEEESTYASQLHKLCFDDGVGAAER